MPNVGAGSAKAVVGAHVIVLPGAVISHDCVIGDYACVASSVSLAGGVETGEACYLGANCTIMNGVKLGRHCLVGMGAVVSESAPERAVLAATPRTDCTLPAEPARVRLYFLLVRSHA